MKVHDNAAKHRFEITLKDGAVAFADYSIDDDAIAFPHTVVPPHHEGQGIGSALAKAALQSARERGLKVRPQCSFFVTYMRRRPDTHDLLAEGERL